MITIRQLTARVRTLARAALAGLALTVVAGAPALAQEFRGGGAVFAFTPTCTQYGWPVGEAYPVVVRHRAREVETDISSSISIFFGDFVVNLSAWNSTFHPTPTPRRLAGRAIGRSFWNWSNRPMVRVVTREITSLVNPSGPATMENARSIAIRVRINNWDGLPGCAVTLAAALRRRQ